MTTTTFAQQKSKPEYVTISVDDLNHINRDLDYSKSMASENKKTKVLLLKAQKTIDSLRFELSTTDEKITLWTLEAERLRVEKQKLEVTSEQARITYHTSINSMRKYNSTLKTKLFQFESKTLIGSFGNMTTVATLEAVLIVVLLFARSQN